MQRKIKIIIFITAVILFRNGLFGQDAQKLSVGNCPEEIMQVHISQQSVFPGELLWFKVYCSSALFPKEELSSLAFIELVSSENTSILRKKILLQHGEGLGEFEIPGNLPTGLYYVLTYTNWMKNFGEASFSRKELIIVNPFQPLNKIQDRTDSLKSQGGTSLSDNKTNNVKITPDRKIYPTRQLVTIKIETNSTAGKPISADFSVSVCRREPQMIFSTNTSKGPIVMKGSERKVYLPDYKGMRLSGKLMDSSDNGVAGAPVSESTPGYGTDLKRSITDSKGDFNFLLKPKEGEREIVFTLPAPDTKISLEESFWNGFRDPPDNLIFGLNQEAISYLRGKFTHFQFQSRFKKQYFIPNTQAKIAADSSVFYSKPYQLIELKDYMELDSLREYFYELVPSVRISQRRGEIDISVRDSLNMSFLEDKPGVFLDGIFYNDYTAITDIPIKEIDRIAILPKTYYYKDFTFGGIIDIHTKKSDFNSVKLLPNMTRFIYPMANASEWKYKSPNYSIADSHDRVPDFRYLLHWEPNIRVGNSGEAKVQFYTGDVKGNFIVKVIGIDEDGGILQADSEILIDD